MKKVINEMLPRIKYLIKFVVLLGFGLQGGVVPAHTAA